MAKLLAAYGASAPRRAMLAKIGDLKQNARPGSELPPPPAGPGPGRQVAILTQRAMLTNARDLGIFWMRMAMYVMLCLCIGFIYFRMDHQWKAVFSRTALLFFVVAFLTFMSISAFPAFVEDLKARAAAGSGGQQRTAAQRRSGVSPRPEPR